jgi:hypothetical protein
VDGAVAAARAAMTGRGTTVIATVTGASRQVRVHA